MTTPANLDSSRARGHLISGFVVPARFLRSVVDPAFEAAYAELTRLRKAAAGADPMERMRAVFMVPGQESLINEMAIAFCLSIQATWERSVRYYVEACAIDLGNDEAVELSKHTKWARVRDGFEAIQGAPMASFPGQVQLDLLHLLGNTCRHGAGFSLEALQQSNPELWPNGVEPAAGHGAMRGLVVTQALLSEFVEAIQKFWGAVDRVHHDRVNPPEQVARERAAIDAQWAEILRTNPFPGLGRPSQSEQ